MEQFTYGLEYVFFKKEGFVLREISQSYSDIPPYCLAIKEGDNLSDYNLAIISNEENLSVELRYDGVKESVLYTVDGDQLTIISSRESEPIILSKTSFTYEDLCINK